MEVEHQGARGGGVPTHYLCAQHWPVSYLLGGRGGHGRATLVHGLLPRIAEGGQGSPQKEVGHTARGPRD